MHARVRSHTCVICMRGPKCMRTDFCAYADSFSRTCVRTRLHKNVLRMAGFAKGETDLKCAFVIGAFRPEPVDSPAAGNREMSAIISSDKAPRRFNKNVPGSDILFIFDIQPAACVLNVSTLDVRKYL